MTKQESALKSSAKIHTVYKTADGKRVPAVSTILNELNKPALLDWAWKLGTQGINYRDFRDALADVGTVTHRMILDHLSDPKREINYGGYGYSDDINVLARNCFASYLAWEGMNKIEPVMLETPLVSELFRYGGTSDFLGYVNGKLTLLDFKTGKAIYPEHFIQLAGYSAIVNECRPGLGNIEQYTVLNIPRGEGESFDTKTKTSLSAEWGIFQAALKIYQLKKEAAA
jgi:hypothetical protein